MVVSGTCARVLYHIPAPNSHSDEASSSCNVWFLMQLSCLPAPVHRPSANHSASMNCAQIHTKWQTTWNTKWHTFTMCHQLNFCIFAPTCYSNKREHTHTCTHSRTCKHSHICTHSYTHKCMHTDVQVQACAYTCRDACRHKHTHTHARAHTHTHTLLQPTINKVWNNYQYGTYQNNNLMLLHTKNSFIVS